MKCRRDGCEAARGCLPGTTGARVVTKIGQAFDRCPRAWLRDQEAEVMTHIRDAGFLFEHGLLPEAGGILDQNARWLDAVQVIADERERTAQALTKVR